MEENVYDRPMISHEEICYEGFGSINEDVEDDSVDSFLTKPNIVLLRNSLSAQFDDSLCYRVSRDSKE
ncbi:unnamed protein product [Schistosoma bovis]|nr:unnamed protein product [Schistosoma bovis]